LLDGLLYDKDFANRLGIRTTWGLCNTTTLSILAKHVPNFGQVVKGFKISEDGKGYLGEAMKILSKFTHYPTITELTLPRLPNRVQKWEVDFDMITAHFPLLEYLNLSYYGQHRGSLHLGKLKTIVLWDLTENVVSHLIPNESSHTLEKASFHTIYNVFKAQQFSPLHQFKNLTSLCLYHIRVEEAHAIFENARGASYALEHLVIDLRLPTYIYTQKVFSCQSLKQLQTLELMVCTNENGAYSGYLEACEAILKEVTNSLNRLEELVLRTGWHIGWPHHIAKIKSLKKLVWVVGYIEEEDETKLNESIDQTEIRQRATIILERY